MDKWFGGVEGRGWYAPGRDERTPEQSIDDLRLEGTRIAFFWDHGVTVPLWGEDGLLPEDPQWLERELGLSRALVADLAAWAATQDRPGGPTAADATEEERLFLRLRQELAPGLEVVRRW